MSTRPDSDANVDRGGWLASFGLDRPEVRAWVLYDWAVSGWQTTILTTLFPIYYYEVAGAGLPRGKATEWFAAATALSVAAVAVISPVLGAIADRFAARKKLLSACVGLGVLATAGLSLVHTGELMMATVLFVLAYLGASGSLVFYDALLPHVVRRDEVDRVSSIGHAVGYLGGGLLLALDLAWVARPQWFGNTHADQTGLVRQAFVSVAVWWLVFSIPLFLRVSEPAAIAGPVDERGRRLFVDAISRLGATFRRLLGLRQAALMLGAFLIYQAGVETIQKMAAIFGRDVGLGDTDLMLTLLAVQFVGIPFAILFGVLAGRIGAKRSLLLALSVYVAATILAAFLTTITQFVIVAVLVAMVRGGCQSLSRSLYAHLVPARESATFFGLFAVAEKLAGALGPAVFAIAIATTGSSRPAIGALVVFFLVGGAVLAFVDVRRGEALAREA